MFRGIISKTQFCDTTANNIFRNIEGGTLHGDVSFLSTMRALLHSRIPADESVNLRFSSSRHSNEEVQSAPMEVVRSIARECRVGRDQKGIFSVHNICSSDNEATFKALDENFSSLYDYKKNEKITEFFKKSFNVFCYINEANKNVVIFVESLDIKKMHYLQMAILPSMSWYFDSKNGITPEELDLLQSLKEKTSEKYEKAIEKIANSFDFRSVKIKGMLSGFESRQDRYEISRIKELNEEIARKMNDVNERLGRYIEEKERNNIRLMGLTLKAGKNESSELMDYFLCNKKLHLVDVDDRDVYFHVCDYLEYFDKEIVERMIDNKRSYVHVNDNGRAYSGIGATKMVKLLKAIFMEETLRIKLYAGFKLRIAGGLSCMTGITAPDEFKNSIPNTHIDRYGCMGNYNQIINELMVKGDYIGSIEQSIASCKGLNWGDSTVMESFMKYFYKCEDPVVEVPDVGFVTIKEAIEWLEKKEESDKIGEKKEEGGQ